MSSTTIELALIAQLTENYREASLKLMAHKEAVFPPRMPVYVDHKRYKGYGVNIQEDIREPDQLHVLLENGNVWIYPVDTCRPATWKEVPKSNRRAYLRRCGIKTL